MRKTVEVALPQFEAGAVHCLGNQVQVNGGATCRLIGQSAPYIVVRIPQPLPGEHGQYGSQGSHFIGTGFIAHQPLEPIASLQFTL